jgi:hypothetical protein
MGGQWTTARSRYYMSNAGEQIGTPAGAEANSDLLVGRCYLAGPRMLKEGEQMASHFAVTFPQAAAMAVGGCQHHENAVAAAGVGRRTEGESMPRS